MRITVVDLELNQPSERIIQIGAVLVDLQRCTIDSKFNRFVKPGEPLSSDIERLTGITEEDLEDGMSFRDAMRDFWNFIRNGNCAFRVGGWGDDVDLMVSRSEVYNVGVPSKLRIYDLKKVFKFFRSAANLSVRHGDGLKNTVEEMGMEFSGRHHNALDDSINTAQILIRAVDRMGSVCFDEKSP